MEPMERMELNEFMELRTEEQLNYVLNNGGTAGVYAMVERSLNSGELRREDLVVSVVPMLVKLARLVLDKMISASEEELEGLEKALKESQESLGGVR